VLGIGGKKVHIEEGWESSPINKRGSVRVKEETVKKGVTWGRK